MNDDPSGSTSSARIADVLNKDITNRYCADCGTFLIETSKIYASFLPTSFHIDDRWFHKDWIETKHGKNFVEMHEAFAPAGRVPSTRCSRITSKALSGFIANARNDRVALKSIAHGVFICEACAIVHSRLNPSTTKVKLASDPCWSENEYNKMMNKGNSHGNNLLEKFMPEEWLERKKNNFANKLEREVFIRYKYELLDFLFPHVRYGYKNFRRKNQSMTKKKWKSLVSKVDKDADWAVWTLGYKDYKDIKKSRKSPKPKSKKKKKYRVSLQTAQEANRYLVDERRNKINLIASIIKLQAKFRMIMVNKRQLQNYAHAIRSSPCPSFMDVLRRTVIIQSRTRSYLMARDFSTKKIVAITIQAHFRGRKIRLMYNLTREVIIKVQAFIRGCLSRKMIHSEMQARSNEYKKQMVTLWEKTNTPLAYRTKFWMHINSPGYSTFASQEFELRRLWKLLQYDFQNCRAPSMSRDESILANITYSKYLCVQISLDRFTYEFPVTFDSNSDGFKLLESYAERLQLERVQIYERLQRFDGVDQLYQRAGISDEKYKKVKLARSIWNPIEMPLQPESELTRKLSFVHVWSEIEKTVKTDDLATGKTVPMLPDVSADIFDQLFPELRRSSNIKLIIPSKKSLDRIGVNDSRHIPIPLPLSGSTMNFKANMDQQIIHNLAEVSRCFVTGVKHLALAGTLSSGFERFFVEDRQLQAIDSTKYSLIHDFLHTSNV